MHTIGIADDAALPSFCLSFSLLIIFELNHTSTEVCNVPAVDLPVQQALGLSSRPRLYGGGRPSIMRPLDDTRGSFYGHQHVD